MKNRNIVHNKVYYRMVKTTETVNGKCVFMYGIEGFGGGESVSLMALSADRERIKQLVELMNRCGLGLTELKSIVDEFFCECYGSRLL